MNGFSLRKCKGLFGEKTRMEWNQDLNPWGLVYNLNRELLLSENGMESDFSSCCLVSRHEIATFFNFQTYIYNN